VRYYDTQADAVVDLAQPPTSGLCIPLEEKSFTGPNSSFVENTNYQTAWDSTSLGLLKACPRKYYYTIIQGYVSSVLPPPLAFGIHFHTCMETWYKLLVTGMGKDEALLRLTRLAGLLGETIPQGDTARSKESLVRAVVWYLIQFWNDTAQVVTLSNGQPAVEYSFAFPFEKIQGIQTYICGHIDWIAKFQGGIYPLDYKTTKYQLDERFFAQFKPHAQFPNYLLAINVFANEGSSLPEPADGLVVDGIQLGVNFCRYRRQIISYSAEELEEYIHETAQWLELAFRFAEANHWPANETSCDKYGGCTFRNICQKPPQQRELYLKGQYVKKTWDPMRSR